MSAPRKTWAQHSLRWQRQATREGLTPGRWDAWFKLSQKTRREVAPRTYAKGTPARDVIREGLAARVLHKMLNRPVLYVREAQVRKGVEAMTLRQLRWTLTASDSQIRTRARRPPKEDADINPWWYQ